MGCLAPCCNAENLENTSFISEGNYSDIMENYHFNNPRRKAQPKLENDPEIPENLKISDLINMLAFNELGYEFAHKSTIVEVLEKTRPNKSTAMNDAFICGCKSLMELAGILSQLGTLN